MCPVATNNSVYQLGIGEMCSKFPVAKCFLRLPPGLIYSSGKCHGVEKTLQVALYLMPGMILKPW